MILWTSDFEKTPKDSASFTTVPGKIREAKEAIRDHVEVDHMPLDGAAAGQHKHITQSELEDTPASVYEMPLLFSKLLGDDPELYLLDKDGVRETLITTKGLPAGARFSVYTSTVQDIAAGNTEVIKFDTERYDLFGEYDTENYRFYPTPGIYLVSVRNHVTPLSGGVIYGYPTIYLVRSSVEYIISSMQTGGIGYVDAQSGDYIHVKLTAAGVGHRINPGANRGCFAATLLLL